MYRPVVYIYISSIIGIYYMFDSHHTFSCFYTHSEVGPLLEWKMLDKKSFLQEYNVKIMYIQE